MEIINNKISATPRSKYIKYSTTSSSSSTGNISIDVSNFVKKKGETSQTVEGSFSVTGDVIAYKTSTSDIKLPIASTDALGCIKVGANLTIAEDGTLNAIGGGGSGKAEWGFITGTLSSQTDLWNELNKKANTSSLNISNWDSAYNLSHSHSNKSTLDTITSSDISHWDTAYGNSHWHNNKSYLDNINQNLSTTSAVKHSSLTCTGDVIAYSTGTANAPFKYWKPSVNSSGVLSWTNSTSETTPTSVNIKGPKGDKGDPGKDGVDGATFNGGTITNDLQIKKDVAGLTINGYSTGWQGAYLKIVNRALSNYGYAWQNDVGGSSYGSGDLYWQCSNPSNQGSAQNSPWYRVKFFKGNSGSGTCIGAQGAVTNTSDIRCKHRFNDLTNVLSKLDNIQPFYYTWNDDENKIMCLGLSAQDVKPYFPELVHQLGDNPNILSSEEPILGLDYATLGAIVSIAASKELKQLIDIQQEQINQQQAEIEILKTKIEEMKIINQ